MFQAGQKVVCVDDSSNPQWPYAQYPRKGAIYTVREMRDYGEGVGVLLQEIVIPPAPTTKGVVEPVFNINRFRPLDPLQEQLSRIEQEPEPEPAFA